jgi:hypothetical protein
LLLIRVNARKPEERTVIAGNDYFRPVDRGVQQGRQLSFRLANVYLSHRELRKLFNLTL